MVSLLFLFSSLARTLDSGLASTLAQLEGLGETDRCSTATSGVSIRSKQTLKRNKRGETKPDQEQKNIYADKRLLCRCTARGRVRAAPHHQVPLKVDQKL